MTTPLDKALAREVLLDAGPFKVTIAPDGVRINAKGHRTGDRIAWETLLALSEKNPKRSSRSAAPAADVPEAIAADVAREVKNANEALARAGTALMRAGSLPAAVLAEIEPDPVHGRPRHETGWFIEPLLTPAELGAILRVSNATAARLPIPCVTIAGERRFRQSEVRQYLRNQESRF